MPIYLMRLIAFFKKIFELNVTIILSNMMLCKKQNGIVRNSFGEIRV
jgi:hypothetical protein